MAHGSATLRFEAEWRETSEPFGDRRRFCLQYSLSDDTLEVLDKTSPHSRGGQFSKFAKRQRMPRLPVEAGMEAAVRGAARPASGAGPDEVAAMSRAARARYTYTAGPNVWAKATSPITGAPIYEPTTGRGAGASTGPTEIAGFPVLTALASSPAFITAADLVCGGVISVYGRPMLIKTCDPFTVAFGLQKLGIDQRRGFIVDGATVASERAAAAPQLVPKGAIPLPPHTGAMAVGSEEETRVNAYKMIPTYRSERDAAKLYQLQGKCLRFEARLDPRLCDPDDARREFVVSFYLEDDTLQVVERPVENSGLAQGVGLKEVGEALLALLEATLLIPQPLQEPRDVARDLDIARGPRTAQDGAHLQVDLLKGCRCDRELAAHLL